ncbi:MAG: cation:dicarboxylate symporter family transporter [bacterium]
MPVKGPASQVQVPSVMNVFLDLVLKNVFEAFNTGKIAQVVVFAVFLGVTTLLMPNEQKQMLQNGFEVLAELPRNI